MISLSKTTMDELLSSMNKGVRSVLAKEDDGLSLQEWASSVLTATINEINALPEYTYSINGIPLEEVLIPKVFGEFILPESVRFDKENKMQPDILLKPESANFQVNRADLAKAANIIAKLRKLDKIAVSPITDWRQPKSISDIENRMAIEGWGLQTNVKEAIAIEVDGVLKGLFARCDYSTDIEDAENLYVNLFVSKTNIE